MANTNIINAVFGSGICAVTTSAFRANYGMVLRFSGIELPTAFEVDFSNYDVAGRDSVTAIGQNGEVQIPDDLWDSGLNIYAYVYLHPTDDSGVTVYTVTIPVLGRPNRTDEEPTPHEQTVIEQAISALNDAVEQTAADVVAADASASAAAQSEANASVSERSAAASASAALASKNAAESASQSATESASGASESARNAANSASQAAESATSAQESAEQAESSVQSITDDVERAERAATTATGKATEAASSAATASTKAAQAEQSATAAAQSAQSAASAAQNAASSATAAESSASAAETAKQAAQDAQAAAEQAAQSVSGLSEQIAQNTADIADLVQSKAGALIDTATGSIASFVPDATIPTVRGLTVNVEPQQDLHGYDAPWPAGGGVNVLDFAQYFTEGETVTQNGVTATFSNGYLKVTGTNTTTTFNIIYKGCNVVLPAGTYIMPNNLNIRCSIDGQGNNNYAGAITAESSVQMVAFYVFASTNATVDYNIPMMLVKGTTRPTAYAPYSNICPISGWDGVEVTRTGKNLLFTQSVTRGGNQIFVGSNSPSVYPFRLKAGTYTFSYDGTASYCYWQLKGTTNNNIITSGANKYGTFTLPQDGDYRFWFYQPTAEASFYDLQLELGSTATAYEPYQGDTYQIQLGQTVYGCKIYATAGKMVVDRAVYDFTANDVWTKYETGGKVTFNGGDRFPVGIDTSKPCIMSNYPFIKTAYISAQPDKSFSLFSAPWLSVCDSGYSDATTFAQAMAGNRLVYYLATPITIDLTPIEVAVLTGQTNNIWADAGNVSVEYAADLKTYIDQKIAAAVAALS